MTVLCWDGVSLAADKLATDGSGRTTVTKIFRVGNSLVGLTGQIGLAMELFGWFRGGAEAEDFPESVRSAPLDTGMVLIQADGTVYEFQGTPFPFHVEDKRCAFGSGAELAMVAMEMGATAAKAVEVASRHHINCGNGIDVLNLHDLPEALHPTLQ